MPTAFEATLGRHRAWSIAALIILTALAWLWLLGGAGMQMAPVVSVLPPTSHDAAMPGMVMAQAETWTPGRFALTFLMWWTMMVAMMLPSAAPTILLYARAAGHGNAATPPTPASFLAGYLAAWGAFSIAATTLQAILEHADLIGAMQMASQNRWLTASILVATGLYQLSSLKNVCLRYCRNPAQFISRHYRSGRIGAVRMGLLHGSYCVGCCWLLMALLFVGGIMNLAWIALLTVMVAAEKLLPHGRLIALATGWACLVFSLAIMLG